MPVYIDLLTRLSKESAEKAVKEAEGFFANAGQQAGTAFSRRLSSAIEAGNADVANSVKGYERSLRGLEAAMGQVAAQETRLNEIRDKGKASAAQLAAEEEKLVNLQRKVIEATAEATTKQQSMTRSVEEATAATQRLHEVSNSPGFFGGIAKGSGAAESINGLAMTLGSAVSVGTVLGEVLVSGLEDVKEKATELAEHFVDVGVEWDNMSKRIGFTTGLTGEGLTKLTEQVGELTMKVPEGVGAIGNVAAEVQRNLHLTGETASTVTEQILNFDHYSGESAINVRELGRVMALFKAPGEDVSKVLNQIYTAGQNTGVGFNEMLASITKSKEVLRFFGEDVQGAVGLLSQFDQAGINLKTVAPALVKELKAALKAGEDPTKFLGDTIDKIRQLQQAGDEMGAKNLADKVFGVSQRGGGPSVYDAIANGQLDLANASAVLQANTQDINKNAAAAQTLADKWTLTKNALDEAMRPASSALLDQLQPQLDKLVTWVQGHQAEIVQFFKALADAAIVMAEGFTVGVGSTLGALGMMTKGFADAVKIAGEDLHALGALTAWIPGPVGATGRAMESAGDKAAKFGQSADTMADAMLKGSALMGDLAVKGLPGLVDAIDKAGASAENSTKSMELLKTKTEELPTSHEIVLKDNSPEVVKEFEDLGFKVDHLPDGHLSIHVAYVGPNGQPIDPAQLTTPGFTPAIPGETTRPIGGRAGGGPIEGSGTKGKDSVLAWLAPGEHVWTASEVDAAGGHQAVASMRSAVRGYEGGGSPGWAPDVNAATSLYGTAYSQSTRTDCSGMVGRIVNATLGVNAGLPTTQNMGQWLAALGFVPGTGPAGTISVGWYNHGSGPNQGHAAMTLSNGMNAESGGSHGNFIVGGAAAGADSAQFDRHMYLPVMFGEGQGVGGGGGSLGASIPAGASAGYGPQGQAGYYQPNPNKVTAADIRAEKADNRVKELETQQSELKASAKESERQKLADELKTAKEEAELAHQQAAEAQRGDFHAFPAGARTATGGAGRQSAWSSMDPFGGVSDFGLSGGLPGVAKYMGTFLANLALGNPFGRLQAQKMGYGNQVGLPSADPTATGGLPFAGSFDDGVGTIPPGMSAVYNGTGQPEPLSGRPYGTGAQGKGGFNISGGMAGSAIKGAMSMAAPALDAMAPGAGEAAQIGAQLAMRTAQYVGSLAGIGVGGLLETFGLNGSALGDPSKSLPGRIALGFAGAHPTAPNTAGQTAPPLAPKADQNAPAAAGAPGGPLVHIENMHNSDGADGTKIAKDVAWQLQATAPYPTNTR